MRAVRAGEAKLCGRVRDASSDAGAGCLENILVSVGSCASSNAAVRMGFISFWYLFFVFLSLFKWPARGFYGLPFVLTVICMGFKF